MFKRIFIKRIAFWTPSNPFHSSKKIILSLKRVCCIQNISQKARFSMFCTRNAFSGRFLGPVSAIFRTSRSCQLVFGTSHRQLRQLIGQVSVITYILYNQLSVTSRSLILLDIMCELGKLSKKNDESYVKFHMLRGRVIFHIFSKCFFAYKPF